MKLTSLARWFSVVALASTALACDGDKRAPNLSLLPAETKPSANAAEERLRRMQRIMVINGDTGQAEEMEESSFINALEGTCYVNSVCPEAPGCHTACQAMYDLCRAQTMLALTRPQSQMLRLAGNLLVPQQTEEAAQRLAKLGLEQVVAAADDIYKILRAQAHDGSTTWLINENAQCGNGTAQFPANPRLDQTEFPKGTPFVPLATYLGTSFARAFDLYNQLTDALVTASMNSADGELNSDTSIDIATQNALTQRFTGARALGGTVDKLPDSFNGGKFCSQPPMTPAIRAALKVLRDAAPSPADVLSNTISTDDLVNATGGTVPGGSVRQRIANFYFGAMDPATTMPPPPKVLPNGKTMSDQFDLEPGSFEAARAYMREELIAFGRSPSARLDFRLKPDGQPSTYVSYAATGTPPSRPPAAFYGALARGLHDGRQASDSDGAFYLTDGFSLENYSLVYPRFLSAARDIIAASKNSGSTVNDAAAGAVATMLSSNELIGTISDFQSNIDGAPQSWTVIVAGFSPDDGIKLATSDDDLRCAVDGNIEGGSQTAGKPCSLASLLPFQDASGMNTLGGFKKRSLVDAVPGHRRIYLLKPRGAAAGQATLSPGAYEALIGFTTEIDVNNPTFSVTGTMFPIIRNSESRLAALLEPGKDWCSRPRVTCDGALFDERIPLEDELTDDSNGVENSWKRYLDLATAASNEADLLGNEYINAALSKDQNQVSVDDKRQQQLEQANAQLQQLQALCGTNIRIDALSKLFSDNSGNLLGAGATCTGTTPCTAPGYVCQLYGDGGTGRCALSVDEFIKDYSEAASVGPQDPDIQRLRDCLATDEVVPFTSLGDLPLCFWHEGNLQCKAVDPADSTKRVQASISDCPRVLPPPADGQTAKTCADLLTKRPPSATVEQTEPLSYFTIASDGGNIGDRADVYASLRKLTRENWQMPFGDASNPNDPDKGLLVRDKILQSRILEPARLLTFASRFDFEQRPPDYAALLFDGSTMYETGDFTHGTSPGTANDSWPCGGSDVPWTDGTPQTFVCPDPAPGQPNAVNDRQAANAALFRMAAVLKLLSLEPKLEPLADNFGGVYFGQLQRAQGGCEKCSGAKTLVAPDMTSIIERKCDDGMQYDFGFGATACFRRDGIAVPVWDDVRLAGTTPTYVGVSIAGMSPGRWYPDQLPWPYASLRYYLEGQADINTYLDEFQWWGQDLNLPDQSCDGKGKSLCTMKVTIRDVLMALGAIGKAASKPPEISWDQPKEIKTVDDLPFASRYIEHVADVIQSTNGGIVFSDMPRLVADALKAESASGAFPRFGGDLSVQLSAARSAMMRIRGTGPLIASEVRQLSVDVRELGIQLKKVQVHKDLNSLNFKATRAERITQCVTASLQAISTAAGTPKENWATGAGQAGAVAAGLAAVATCANDVAQVNLASDMKDKQNEDAQLDGDLAVAEFDGKFAQHATALQTLSLQLSQGEEDLNAALATIESKREQARGALSTALFAASYQSQAQAQLTNAFGNLTEGKQIRYTNALHNARRLAFLAKRAIEQRLGLHLADIAEDYPLVDAPAKWEATACKFTGLDYKKLIEANPDAPQSFANGFIGDYVKKLSNFIESYRIKNNFHEGTDTAVVSLRDDIMNVRSPCKVVDSANLLDNAGQLGQAIQPGWKPKNCPTQTVQGQVQPVPDCVNATPRPPISGKPDMPLFGDPDLARTVGYNLEFGAASTATSAWIQAKDLAAGLYRFTWYTKESSGGGVDAGSVLGAATDCNDTTQPLCIKEKGVESATPVNGWYRRYISFRARGPQTVEVGFSKVAGTISISAPMLERLEDINKASALVPFVNTGGTVNSIQPVCEDSDGRFFRALNWTHGCVKLCPDGFADNCSTDRSHEYCYWQTDFGLDQRAIQTGKVFNFSGFARGNFNYRIDSVGINFVGTSTKDCSDSAAPQACYGNSNIPFSLAHTGPFFVRNFNGDDVEAKVFDGNIEHARGLALERYLTNPLSSTDDALINQYRRHEFSGRPLDGNFVLRVWEEPGVNFNAIQDVQVVLNYRYWTKFN